MTRLVGITDHDNDWLTIEEADIESKNRNQDLLWCEFEKGGIYLDENNAMALVSALQVWLDRPKPKKLVRYLNLYSNGDVGMDFQTETEAKKHATSGLIETRKIEWEVSE